MALQLLPILLYGAVAYAVVSRKKKKKKNGKRCPPEVAMNPMTSEEFRELARSEYEKRSGDPIGVANEMFKILIPAPCTKKDFKTTLSSGQIGEGTDLTGWGLAKVYALVVIGVLESNLDVGDERDLEYGRRLMNHIATWYSQLTSEPLPDID